MLICMRIFQKLYGWTTDLKFLVPLFAYEGCVRAAYRIFVNPTSDGSRPLGGTPTMDKPVLVWTYRNCAIVEVWLPLIT